MFAYTDYIMTEDPSNISVSPGRVILDKVKSQLVIDDDTQVRHYIGGGGGSGGSAANLYTGNGCIINIGENEIDDPNGVLHNTIGYSKKWVIPSSKDNSSNSYNFILNPDIYETVNYSKITNSMILGTDLDHVSNSVYNSLLLGVGQLVNSSFYGGTANVDINLSCLFGLSNPYYNSFLDSLNSSISSSFLVGYTVKSYDSTASPQGSSMDTHILNTFATGAAGGINALGANVNLNHSVVHNLLSSNAQGGKYEIQFSDLTTSNAVFRNGFLSYISKGFIANSVIQGGNNSLYYTDFFLWGSNFTTAGSAISWWSKIYAMNSNMNYLQSRHDILFFTNTNIDNGSWSATDFYENPLISLVDSKYSNFGGAKQSTILTWYSNVDNSKIEDSIVIGPYIGISNVQLQNTTLLTAYSNVKSLDSQRAYIYGSALFGYYSNVIISNSSKNGIFSYGYNSNITDPDRSTLIGYFSNFTNCSNSTIFSNSSINNDIDSSFVYDNQSNFSNCLNSTIFGGSANGSGTNSSFVYGWSTTISGANQSIVQGVGSNFNTINSSFAVGLGSIISGATDSIILANNTSNVMQSSNGIILANNSDIVIPSLSNNFGTFIGSKAYGILTNSILITYGTNRGLQPDGTNFVALPITNSFAAINGANGASLPIINSQIIGANLSGTFYNSQVIGSGITGVGNSIIIGRNITSGSQSINIGWDHTSASELNAPQVIIGGPTNSETSDRLVIADITGEVDEEEKPIVHELIRYDSDKNLIFNAEAGQIIFNTNGKTITVESLLERIAALEAQLASINTVLEEIRG